MEVSPNLLILFCTAIVMTIVSDTAAYIMSIVSPYACIFVGYLIYNLGSYFKKSKDDLLKMFLGILLIGAIIAATFSFFTLYNNSSYQAKNTGIGNYGAQWDSAMAWVRANTPINSIFVHWWDYGIDPDSWDKGLSVSKNNNRSWRYPVQLPGIDYHL